MRRSSSTTSRCGASSASVSGMLIAARSPTSSIPRLGGAVGARDQSQHAFAVGRVVRAGTEFAEGVVDALGLQGRELERQRLALLRDVKQPLAAVLRALFLQHVALVYELLEHPAERLL